MVMRFCDFPKAARVSRFGYNDQASQCCYSLPPPEVKRWACKFGKVVYVDKSSGSTGGASKTSLDLALPVIDD